METIKIIAVVILVIAFFIALIWGAVWGMVMGIKQPRCLNAYENYQPEFGFWEGCRIMVDGKLTPVDIVRELK